MASNAPVRPPKEGGNTMALAVSDILDGKMLYTGKFKSATVANLMIWDQAETIITTSGSETSTTANPGYLEFFHSIVDEQTGEKSREVVTKTVSIDKENIIETADINGDGFTDLIVRDESKAGEAPIHVWYMKDGQIANRQVFGMVTNQGVGKWDIVVNGSGDFNGDGRDDLLLQDHETGQLAAWLSTADGGHVNSTGGNGLLTSDWEVVGVGNFNGDGQEDILIRNINPESSGYGDIFVFGQDETGSIDTNLITYLGRATDGWAVKGIGDFDGNNCDDILFVYEGTPAAGAAGNDAGAVAAWMMKSDWVGWGYDWESDPTGVDWNANKSVYFGGLERSFGLVAADDFNGDGVDDIALANVDDQNVYAWITSTDGSTPGIGSVIALG